MSAIGYAALGAVLLLARWWYPRALEAAAARRHAMGGSGNIRGAEPILLEGRAERGGVLVLHGFGDTPESVSALAASLHARGYSVYAPCLAGHGGRLEDFAQSSGEMWLASAREAWRAVRAAHPHAALVGQSLGGVLAVLLASEDPEARALVLLAPYLDVPVVVRRLSVLAPALQLFLPYLTTQDERSIHDPIARGRSLSFGATTPHLTRELMACADRARAALPGLRLPTLYVQPREDNRIAPAVAERAFAAIGSAEKVLVWLDGSGHVAAADYARDRVAKLTGDWLDAR